MKIFASYDEAGTVKGFFIDEVNGADAIPAESVEITNAEWQGHLSGEARIAVDPDRRVVIPFVPPAESEAEIAARITAGVRAEVARRILAEASQATQMNMAAAGAAGLLSADDQAAFREALGWVASTRAKGAELAAALDPTFADDAHWPEPSAAARALAARF